MQINYYTDQHIIKKNFERFFKLIDDYDEKRSPKSVGDPRFSTLAEFWKFCGF